MPAHASSNTSQACWEHACTLHVLNNTVCMHPAARQWAKCARLGGTVVVVELVPQVGLRRSSSCALIAQYGSITARRCIPNVWNGLIACLGSLSQHCGAARMDAVPPALDGSTGPHLRRGRRRSSSRCGGFLACAAGGFALRRLEPALTGILQQEVVQRWLQPTPCGGTNLMARCSPLICFAAQHSMPLWLRSLDCVSPGCGGACPAH